LFVKNLFQREFRLTFAGALHTALCAPRSIGLGTFHRTSRKALAAPSTFIDVRGKLPLREHGENGETTVGVRVLVFPNWMDRLPMVYTDASFLRSERDWHVPMGNLLCYCQDAEWRWKIGELWDTAESSAIIDIGSAWCLRNIDSLVTRHLHGSRYGFTKWPKEWGQWSHDKEGLRECEEFIRKQKAA
jgi:hypothetical protein